MTAKPKGHGERRSTDSGTALDLRKPLLDGSFTVSSFTFDKLCPFTQSRPPTWTPEPSTRGRAAACPPRPSSIPGIIVQHARARARDVKQVTILYKNVRHFYTSLRPHVVGVTRCRVVTGVSVSQTPCWSYTNLVALSTWCTCSQTYKVDFEGCARSIDCRAYKSSLTSAPDLRSHPLPCRLTM